MAIFMQPEAAPEVVILTISDAASHQYLYFNEGTWNPEYLEKCITFVCHVYIYISFLFIRWVLFVCHVYMYISFLFIRWVLMWYQFVWVFWLNHRIYCENIQKRHSNQVNMTHEIIDWWIWIIIKFCYKCKVVYSWLWFLWHKLIKYAEATPHGITLTHFPLDKWLPFSRRHFQMRFHWSLFIRVQLTIFRHWFRWWLGTKQVTSHYLNQWWPSLLMHTCITQPQWVNISVPFYLQINDIYHISAQHYGIVTK